MSVAMNEGVINGAPRQLGPRLMLIGGEWVASELGETVFVDLPAG